MKKNCFIFTVVALLCISIAFAMVGCNNVSYNLSYDDSGYSKGNFTIDKTEDINEVEIEWISGDITLKYEGDCISATETYDTTPNESLIMRYRVQDGVLSIKYMANTKIKTKPLVKPLTICFPSEFVVPKITVKNVSGNVDANTFAALNASFELITGNLSLNAFSSEKLFVKAVTGNISFKKVEALQTDLKITTGNLIATSLHTNNLTADTVTSDYTFADLECKTLNLHAVSGNIFIGYGAKTTGISVKANIINGNFAKSALTSKDGRYISGDASSTADISLVDGNLGVTIATE